jgi:hypothetical protein
MWPRWPATAACQPPEPLPSHGNPDRLPVCRLAVALARLPVIATRHCSTLALSSPRGRLHRSRGQRPGRTAGDRALRHPDQATARPIGSRCAASPSTWPACRRSPPGTARPWRCHRLVAGFTNREDEEPEEMPVIESRQHGPDYGNRGLPATRHHDQATARPIGSRCAASPSTWPACRRSPPGTARPGRCHRLVAGCTDREDKGPEELPVIEHSDTLTRPRPARSAAVALPRLRPGPLASDRHPALLDTGAVIASWPAAPIERTKARKNCR